MTDVSAWIIDGLKRYTYGLHGIVIREKNINENNERVKIVRKLIEMFRRLSLDHYLLRFHFCSFTYGEICRKSEEKNIKRKVRWMGGL